jgi:hypothetical protein
MSQSSLLLFVGVDGHGATNSSSAYRRISSQTIKFGPFPDARPVNLITGGEVPLEIIPETTKATCRSRSKK